MPKKPEIVITMKTYMGEKLVDESAKVIKPGPDWLMWTIGTLVFLLAGWAMAIGGMFR